MGSVHRQAQRMTRVVKAGVVGRGDAQRGVAAAVRPPSQGRFRENAGGSISGAGVSRRWRRRPSTSIGVEPPARQLRAEARRRGKSRRPDAFQVREGAPSADLTRERHTTIMSPRVPRSQPSEGRRPRHARTQVTATSERSIPSVGHSDCGPRPSATYSAFGSPRRGRKVCDAS